MPASTQAKQRSQGLKPSPSSRGGSLLSAALPMSRIWLVARLRSSMAQRMTVLPGFIDTHCHPSGVNELLRGERQRSDGGRAAGALRKKAAARPRASGSSGYMFDDTKLDRPLHSPAISTRSRPSHPIVVNHRGGHTSWYNSEGAGAGRHHAADARSATWPVLSRCQPASSPAVLRSRRAACSAASASGSSSRREQSARARRRNGHAHISELLTAAGLDDRARRRRRARDTCRTLRRRLPRGRAAPPRVHDDPRPRLRATAARQPASYTGLATSGSALAA